MDCYVAELDVFIAELEVKAFVKYCVGLPPTPPLDTTNALDVIGNLPQHYACLPFIEKYLKLPTLNSAKAILSSNALTYYAPPTGKGAIRVAFVRPSVSRVHSE